MGGRSDGVDCLTRLDVFNKCEGSGGYCHTPLDSYPCRYYHGLVIVCSDVLFRKTVLELFHSHFKESQRF